MPRPIEATLIINRVENLIFKIRDENVILDKDIASLYNVTTGALNQAVKRNIDRFPKDFMFQLTEEECISLQSQIVIAKKGRGGSRTLPYVFTEHGVLMLASVLRSETAVSVSIYIARTFAAMRRQIAIASDVSADIAMLKAKLDLIENELEQNLESVNDLSEDMRKEIDNIYQAIAALSLQNTSYPAQANRKKIGFK